ncbi:T9SS type A sorting domain-containing protein [Flavobacterium sp. N502540]|uniref:T9SS type A sorting domain-containing protein n=1 Tax=Flavobacterium sp. N502540 TaxID=2986838 RepID=UPI002225859A|nr:T9SS type A sorting domain-containing protein [Flavobacterium sp. N502540]
MKKVYLFISLLISTLSFSQQTISFENAEGFTLGDINRQNGWTTVGQNQIITQGNQTDGNNALKITNDPNLGKPYTPYIGAYKDLPIAFPGNFTISFDIKITEQSPTSSSFFFGIDSPTNRGYDILIFNNDGNFTDYTGNFTNATATWTTNTWYRVKVERTASKISYYLNGTLIKDTNKTSEITGMAFGQSPNSSGSAYIDNIKINNESKLSVQEFLKYSDISVYPNPTTDYINIKSPTKIKSIKVYEISGKKINVKLEGDKINVKNLAAATYLLNVETDGGNFTKRFIKE